MMHRIAMMWQQQDTFLVFAVTQRLLDIYFTDHYYGIES
jgi:hypothetical protein